jgi:hypothetical protein
LYLTHPLSSLTLHAAYPEFHNYLLGLCMIWQPCSKLQIGMHHHCSISIFSCSDYTDCSSYSHNNHQRHWSTYLSLLTCVHLEPTIFNFKFWYIQSHNTKTITYALNLITVFSCEVILSACTQYSYRLHIWWCWPIWTQ